ncbi:MAG: alpha/beta hydrolase [Hyphomonadaceae bacterium]|nr:alpha/beta hydrolase [Hyphomonadaceae bacterium]
MALGQIEAFEHQGVRIAYERVEGDSPTFVWLGGFKSDMAGTKAQTLADWAHETGQAFVRFDYSGHGRSGGRFEDGTISSWLGDTLAVLDQLTSGPLVLVGSSMGGWLALLAARARPDRVSGLLLIAPAADFTERLIWRRLTPKEQRQMLANGRLEQPSEYSPEPNIITRDLIEDGRKHLVMDGPIPFNGPCYILQGQADPDVPREHVIELASLITTDNALLHLIKDGDHRLSRPEDLKELVKQAAALARQLAH